MGYFQQSHEMVCFGVYRPCYAVTRKWRSKQGHKVMGIKLNTHKRLYQHRVFGLCRQFAALGKCWYGLLCRLGLYYDYSI